MQIAGGRTRRPARASPRPRLSYAPVRVASSPCSAAALPAPGAHQLAAAALVFAVVGALPRVVRVAVRGAPAPEVAAPALAAPAVAPVGAGSTPPEGTERLHTLACRAALHAWRGPRGPTGAPRGGKFRHHAHHAYRAGGVPALFYCYTREIAM